jgi:hypothetical protein
MTRTITWRGIIAHVGISGIDGRKLDTLKFDRLPVPVYWYDNLYDIHNRQARNFHLLGKVTRAWLHWEKSVNAARAEADMELDLATLPNPDETLWPEIDLDRDLGQLTAVCLGIRPTWKVDPVIVVTQP